MDDRLKSWLFENYFPSVQQFLDFFQEGIVVINKSGKINYINESYCKFLKVSKERTTGADIEKIIPTTQFKKIMESGKRQINKYHVYEDSREVIANRLPISIDGRLEGMIGQVILKSRSELEQILRNYNILREKVQHAERHLDRITNTSVYCFDDIVAEDESLLKVKKMAYNAARSLPPIHLEGESGTGKELFAHSIHNASNRRNSPFIRLNCAAIPADLIEAELFGYEKGAFTGALKSGKPGKFEQAHNGIIFLDEIGEMPLHMQSKLLRVLEDGEVTRVGGTRARKIDFCFISATNRNLEELTNTNEFRLDLFFRLSVVHLRLPPLRDLPQTLPILWKRMLNKKASRIGRLAPALSVEIEKSFKNYAWPGNARELSNVIESALNLCDEDTLTLSDLPHRFLKSIAYSKNDKELGKSNLHEVVGKIEKDFILKSLEETDYNISAAAKQLGIHRTWLYQKIKNYNIKILRKDRTRS